MAKKRIPLNVMELQQVKAFRAAGLTYHAISKRLDRDPKTIKKACLNPERAPQIAQVKVALADRFENVAVRMLTAISDEDINALDAYKKTLSAAISTDKMRLLTGQSTANIALHEIVEAMERERKNGPKELGDGDDRERRDGDRQKQVAQEGEE